MGFDWTNLFQVMTFLRVILNYPRRGCRTLSKKNGLIYSELLETVDKHDSTISRFSYSLVFRSFIAKICLDCLMDSVRRQPLHWQKLSGLTLL